MYNEEQRSKKCPGLTFQSQFICQHDFPELQNLLAFPIDKARSLVHLELDFSDKALRWVCSQHFSLPSPTWKM